LSRPFDEARYKGLLEGLEITEMLLSDARRENDKLRIDSGYFAKPMLKAEALVRAYPSGYDELGPLFSRFVKGVFDINAESYTDSGIPFLRILNLRGGVIDDSDLALIPESVHENEKKTELRWGDIVLSKTAYPSASLVTLDRCNTSQDTIATTLSEYGRETYSPEAIVAYLNCPTGQRLLWRQFQGNVQLHLSLDDGRKVPMPRLGQAVQAQIKTAFDRANELRNIAAIEFDNASNSLLRNLKIEAWRPIEPLSYTRGFTDTLTAERFDAEYFHPVKTAAHAFLNAMPGKPLNAMFRSVRELWQPGNAPANEVVRNYDLNDALSPFLDDTKTPTYPAEIASTKKRIKKGDIVVSRLRSYLKEIAVVQTEGGEPLVCSTEFIVLRPKAGAIPVEALLVYLRSTLPQLIFKWSQDGSNHPRFDEKELLNLHVPDIVASISQELSDSVKAATRARQHAAELLDAAKRAVEIAIEKDEKSALAYLEAQA
jgi:type I restriction enzyme S subunit